MNRACQVLIGEHDLIPFVSPADGRAHNTVRLVNEAGVRKEGDFVIFDIVAGSFLPHQLRNTVGSLITVGQGRLKVGDFCEMARSKQPGIMGPAAPACGLCLVRVNYPDLWGSTGEGQ